MAKTNEIKWNLIPKNLRDELKQAGVDPASDSKTPSDVKAKYLSPADLLNAHYRAYNKKSNLAYLRETVRNLFIYLYGTDQKELADKMREEINKNSPDLLGKVINDVPNKVYSIEGEQDILRKGIILSIDIDIRFANYRKYKFEIDSINKEVVLFADSDKLTPMPLTFGKSFTLKRIQFSQHRICEEDNLAISAIYVDKEGNERKYGILYLDENF